MNNRTGALQSSLLQQMIMGESPSWCNPNGARPPGDLHEENSPCLQSMPSSSAFSQYPQLSNFLLMNTWSDKEDMPGSWSQFLLGGLVGDHQRYSSTPFQGKQIQNWEGDQVIMCPTAMDVGDQQQDHTSERSYGFSHGSCEQTLQPVMPPWNQNRVAASSPNSCITTSLGSSMLDFSVHRMAAERGHHQSESECNSSATGSALKKARVQASSSVQSTLKVRKERLGDRIAALHQIVSPFGKTDTASVLQETIGYIRFLLGQIEALSHPYLGTGPPHIRHPLGQGDNSLFHLPGQLLNNNISAQRGPPEQVVDGDDEAKKDLRNRGLCLVPVSYSMHFGGDNGADYWGAPAIGMDLR